MATVNGTSGRDFIHRAGDGRTVPAGFNEIATVTAAADVITAGRGDDIVLGDAGDDLFRVNPATDGYDRVSLGAGLDSVELADTGAQVRLTFTSAEVGNDKANDSGSMMNQDGGLAVRLQREGGGDALVGAVSRYDDEGITFVSSGKTTFDVRDLVSGIQRGDQFRTVTLGTIAGDTFGGTEDANYINGGQGADTLSGGLSNDFLVGGAGDDTLNGGADDDSFIGGGGSDTIIGGAGLSDAGADTFIFNVSTDGLDTVDLGGGHDVVMVNAAAATNVRLTFTSAEVGNGAVNDAGTMTNQDGGLAVRLQAEAGGTPLMGATRLDDEGTTFVGGVGVTFDVRDLVSGVARGETFEVVTLGTIASDSLTAIQNTRPYYINGGAGNDTITGGDAADFLVGGSGNDSMAGGDGNDTFLGGDGADRLDGGAGADTMTGAAGNDTYVVDKRGDVVTEAANGGFDKIESTINQRLGAEVEMLSLTGSRNLDGRGNILANIMTGNTKDNKLAGEDGDDRLNGNAGNDILTGGAGADVFAFDAKLDGQTNVDAITDFEAGDLFWLDSTVFVGLVAGELEDFRFKEIANATSNAGVDRTDRILYDRDEGDLYFDRDGSGRDFGRVQFASVADNLDLRNTDFLITA